MNIHPLANVAQETDIGPDCVIEAYCVVGYGDAATASETTRPVRIGLGSHLRQFTVIYWGTEIGKRFHSGHKANIRESCSIGDDVSIGTLSVIEHHVRIGSRVRIHSQAFIPEYSIIEDDVFIGPNVVLTNAKYPASPDVKAHLRGPLIKTKAIIGANATILPGVVIGSQAVVGAGSVVTRDVETGTVVAGNPARAINTVSALPYE